MILETTDHAYAFDVYGTLIDTSDIIKRLEALIGKDALKFYGLWRNKQLEYAYRRALMGAFQPFELCNSQALDFTCAQLGFYISKECKARLLSNYLELPAFDDAAPGLRTLIDLKQRIVAFSNGSEDVVKKNLVNAGLYEYLPDIISTEGVKSFKPCAIVYEYLTNRIKTTPKNVCLVSSNPFDIIGAKSFGMGAVWIQRTEQTIFDPWEFEPDLTISSLFQLE